MGWLARRGRARAFISRRALRETVKGAQGLETSKETASGLGEKWTQI